ncbi:MAG: hypothetical protein D6731_09315 [Planctomycetota bacterium]|nr:MAG: hypothetical protein D6731_09315 [Planctomycetota bacterium]
MHRVRDLPHQRAVAVRILEHTRGSEVLEVLLNPGYLRKARHALAEVGDHLRAIHEGIPGEECGRVDEAEARVDALREALAELIPADDDAPAPPAVLALRGRPPREQIRAYEELLAPVRREATGLLLLVDQPSFPATPLLREAVVRVISALARAVPSAPPVQDDYSLRCAPQVLACAHRALQHAAEVLAVEINSATDNPLLFPPEPPGGFASMTEEDYARWLAEPKRAEGLARCVLGGGNFHGEPVGMVMDYLAAAIAEVGNIAERRIAHLVDEGLSNGLPAFLMESSGLNSGFMIPQYTAAALVSENKVLAHPATVDSIPTCAGSEDHVSMGTIAARQAAQVLDNVLWVLAIELLAEFQALNFRLPLRPGEGARRVLRRLEAAGLRPYSDDRVMYSDVQRVRELLRERPPVLGGPA